MSSNANAVSSAKTADKPASSKGTTTRPSLKNLSRARVPRAGLIGVTIATVSALAWKFSVSDPHKKYIADFYK